MTGDVRDRLAEHDVEVPEGRRSPVRDQACDYFGLVVIPKMPPLVFPVDEPSDPVDSFGRLPSEVLFRRIRWPGGELGSAKRMTLRVKSSIFEAWSDC